MSYGQFRKREKARDMNDTIGREQKEITGLVCL